MTTDSERVSNHGSDGADTAEKHLPVADVGSGTVPPPGWPDPAATAGAAAIAPTGVVARMVNERRNALSSTLAQRSSDGTWGLALSGGGIRSATFCFGLLKALAHNRVLHRFDILSTVSGGGYIGSMLGKLCQNADIKDVEEALADADKHWFAFWLRANGRYLIPHGLKDAIFAGANFGRNLLGIHIELSILGLILGGLLAGLDLGIWRLAEGTVMAGGGTPPALVALLAQWPTFWILLPPVVFSGGVVAAAYWCLPEHAGDGLAMFRWAVALCSLVVASGIAWNVAHVLIDPSKTVATLTIVLIIVGCSLVAVFAGTLVAQVMSSLDGASPDLSRNRLTGALSVVLLAGLGIAALGLVDLCAWQLAVAAGNPASTAAWIALAVVVLRALLPQIADLPRGLAPLSRMFLAELMNLAGLAALAALFVFWISLVHRSVTLPLFDPQSGLDWTSSVLWLLLVEILPLIFMFVSRGNRAFLNRSSLFSFYRARLVRSYLGAANPARFPANPMGALGRYPVTATTGGTLSSVREVTAGDDQSMTSYEPFKRGGPVHLLNVCVNQTEEVRHGLFNIDRKGLSITVGPRGYVCVGQEDWHTLDQSAELTLGGWTAISGAAVAPGLGATTRPGLAALLTMAGIRLGYWWDSGGLKARGPVGKTVGKYGQLLGELRGKFAGTERGDWYLSDGGHFENTAAYALLREQCELIVVADCGADPRYAFGDLENLVRKARIDLQAEITFLRPAARNPSDRLNPLIAFGSLNDLASADGHACLCLARVDYLRTGASGYLVVVKPNMCAGAPVDLVNFKADNRIFPQESTTDQFFSEAQWESYFQLGTLLGSHLRPSFLNELASHAGEWFRSDDGSVSAPVEDKTRTKPEPKRIPSRIAATGAVTASLSLGALATMAASAWDVLDAQLQTMRSGRRIDPALLKELADDFGKIPPMATATSGSFAPINDAALGKIASSLARINEEVCNDANKRAFQQNSLMKQFARTTVELCGSENPRHASCERLLSVQPLTSCLLPRDGFQCEPRYWIRGYDPKDPPPLQQNCLYPERPLVTASLYGLLDVVLPGAGTWILGDGKQSVTAVSCSASGASDGSSDCGLDTAASAAAPASAASSPVVSASSASSVESAAVAAAASSSASSAESAASSSAAASSSTAGSNDSGRECVGQSVYVQIFGPEQRDSARAYRDPWRARGANVPTIEDVWDTARRAGRPAPRAPAVTTIRYSDPASLKCVDKLAPSGTIWEVSRLPPTVAYTPGVIEVWIPPDVPSTGLPTTGECYQEDSLTTTPRYGIYCFSSRVQCDVVRGPNKNRMQSTCQTIDLRGQDALLRRRGFGGSWYSQRDSVFGSPFPGLGQAGGTAPPLSTK